MMLAGHGRGLLAGTFLQLWQDHKQWPAEKWDALFEDMAEMGLKELILQWSAWGDLDYYELAEMLARRAGKSGMGLWLGLWQDPAWFQAPDLSAMAARGLAAAAELRRRLGRDRWFRGWYVPGEVSEDAWVGPRLAELERHVAGMARKLDGPLAVSGFTNGRTAPEELALFWERVARGTGVAEVWLQDGIGAGKLGLEDWEPRLRAVASRLRKSRAKLRVVVELFEREPGGEFKARPAVVERVRRQAELAARYGRGGALAFSVPDYWSRVAGPEAAQRPRVSSSKSSPFRR
jgi:hypothetical protein